jgi:hypothetical protein
VCVLRTSCCLHLSRRSRSSSDAVLLCAVSEHELVLIRQSVFARVLTCSAKSTTYASVRVGMGRRLASAAVSSAVSSVLLASRLMYAGVHCGAVPCSRLARASVAGVYAVLCEACACVFACGAWSLADCCAACSGCSCMSGAAACSPRRHVVTHEVS